MSIIYGIRSKNGTVVDRQRLEELSLHTSRFAIDSTAFTSSSGTGMGLQPYYTHQRSALDSKPFTDDQGNMIALDGRLDNYSELCKLLDLDRAATADSQIVLSAFCRWGEDCFSKLLGDWALSLWSAPNQTLYLARDHAGTRTLYFEETNEEIYWSTCLETFLSSGQSRKLDPLYVARYLACHPIRELTPYHGIQAVPAAQYIAFGEQRIHRKHWSWHDRDVLQYHCDSDYDEHFLYLFHQSVRRRLDGSELILAQLSGGVDSSSIVCMADVIARESNQCTPHLVDTISYFDDSEPNWDERPYFSVIEAARKKAGVHIETSYRKQWFGSLSTTFTCSLPGIVDSSLQDEKAQEAILTGQDYRVILSGLGGDELLGGNPDPLPELADAMVAGNPIGTVSRAVDYCLLDRTPLWSMLWKAISYTVGLYYDRGPRLRTVPPWIHPRIRRLLDDDRAHDPRRIQQFRVAPSVLENGLSWLSTLESLPHATPSIVTRREYRYPYLDRDLVEFLLRVPRSQLVKPGRRRHLMRRALRKIVPSEVLERRRKASLLTGPLICLQRHEPLLEDLLTDPLVQSFELINSLELRKTLSQIRQGLSPPGWPSLLRLMLLTAWLKNRGSSLQSDLRI